MTQNQSPKTAAPSSPSELLNRLRLGQAWLVSAKEDLAALPDMGVGSKLEEQFNLAFITWATWETAWRVLTGSKACVMGFECDPESPILCERCKR